MSGQNRSSAVMQQRSEPHDSLEDFPTPPWATRALCERLYDSPRPWGLTVREPAANRGHMVRPLAEYFDEVIASDVHDYGAGYRVQDYLLGDEPEVDWTITNPPFRLAEDFIARALAQSREGVAVIVRSAFLEGIGRYGRLFGVTPPAAILQFTERVVMHKGRLSEKGSTATAYCWVVWHTRIDRSTPTLPAFHWIGPCRKRLEHDGDYPDEPAPETAVAPLFNGEVS